jgi:two-component system cell cycle response regulator
MSDSHRKLVAHYQYDPLKRLRSLEILGIGLQDREIIHRIHREFLDPKIGEIVDRFYLYLWQQEEFKPWIKNPQRLNQLKISMNKYLHELGIACDSEEYFEGRMRIGLIHAQIGLPLSNYISACHLLRCFIMDAVPPSLREDIDAYLQVNKLISAIMTLDMTLAVEAYHYYEVETLASTVEHLRHESTSLRQQALYDSLTGVYNHEQIISLLRKAMGDVPHDHALCLIMADLDHFKRVNDTYGHLTGDAVLKWIASRLRRSLRAFDHIGRYGGEEFMIILQNTDLEEGREIASRLRQTVSSTPFHTDDINIKMTISLGLTQFRIGDTAKSFIERADTALYQAKHTGRNRVSVIT